MSKKKSPFEHLGISWQRMKVGVIVYKGSAKGAKANVCRANLLYKPKKWRSYKKEGDVFVERLE